MQIDVSARLDGIDFAPKDVLTEIIQNVRTIISTTQFSVPLDRRFGIDGTVIDLPLPVAMARISAEVIRAITEYEPRCRVVSVDFESTAATDAEEGHLLPKVSIAIKEEWIESVGGYESVQNHPRRYVGRYRI